MFEDLSFLQSFGGRDVKKVEPVLRLREEELTSYLLVYTTETGVHGVLLVNVTEKFVEN